ncbi:MAG: TIGR02147 family protein [Proteobacteria bacterium]|nr:MAG: TIGR02147 family protein [Pseudomonadota bacterium]
MTVLSTVSIFGYLNFRLFLEDYVRVHYLDKGKSYRALSKHCGINSPNYFQQIIADQKNMSAQMAEKVAVGLHLNKTESAFFTSLVRLDSTNDSKEKIRILEELKAIMLKHGKKTRIDEGFHSNWVNQVIWTLAQIKGFPLTVVTIQHSVRGSIASEEIERSLAFLIDNKYLVYDAAAASYTPQNLQIETANDLRNFDLRNNHFRFLQMAQLRLGDALQEREFQGLTFAIARSQIPELKEKIREFVVDLGEKLGEPTDPDVVMRIQIAAFILGDSKKPLIS